MRLAVGFCNGLGNFVIFSSVLQALASISEGGQVDLILDYGWPDRPLIETMAKKMPFVRNVIAYPNELNVNAHDAIYMSFHGVFHSKISEHVHGRKKLDMTHYTCWAESFEHELDFYYHEIRQRFKYRGPIFPQFMPTADLLPMKLPPGPKIVFANGYARTSNNDWERKLWPYFAELGYEIANFYKDSHIYLVGGHEDWEWAESVISKVGTGANFHNMAGLLDLIETAKLIKESDFFIGNDSVAMHIADALRVPGITLFGSTLVSKNGPVNNTIIPVRSPLQCAPCQSSVQFSLCKTSKKCMSEISIGQVAAIMRQIFHPPR